MYKALMTGGTGFIGSHVWKFLANKGYEVEDISKLEFMNEDFHRLQSFTPDVVVHCAWTRQQDLFSTEHLEFAELSCYFLKECKKRGVRVINIGSSSEYGIKYDHFKEDMSCEPINTYGIAKLVVTLFAKNLGYNTLRLFTVTGEGGHSFQDIYKTAEKWSYPHDIRHYVDVQTVCVCIERMIHAPHLYGEIINIANTQYGMQSNQVIAGKENEGSEKWNKYPQRQYEPSFWQADTTRMRKLLNI